jgi:hypothetical protein
MPYTLNFSDSSKVQTVTVPDMPPGINTVDTSLNLIGRGYPNYGQKYAENFLHLLENFANSTPPANPIEGQLWYDTSDPHNKVLRVMDGTATAVRWPSVSGIYQQTTDPKNSPTAGLKNGDIWVDTINNQLKIYSNNVWNLVGPSFSNGNGSVPEQIYDTSNQAHYVIKDYINNQVVSIVASESFTPRITIPGFPALVPGINLSNSDGIASTLNGTAYTTQNLLVSGQNYASSAFLRKTDTSITGQIISGRVRWQADSTNNQNGWPGRDGIVMITGSTPATTQYVQFLKLINDAVVVNTTPGGNIVLQATPSSGPTNTIITANATTVGINTVTSYATLDVNGTSIVRGIFTVTSTASNAIDVAGGVSIGGELDLDGNLNVSGTTTSTGLLTLGSNGSGTIIQPATTNNYDIGSSSLAFRNIYASIISNGTTSVSVTQLCNLTTSSFCPPGLLSPFAGVSAPTGWLLCDGSTYSTSTYSALYNVIKTTYGNKLPDMRNSTTATSSTSFISYIIKT